jgi:hypothetical protein
MIEKLEAPQGFVFVCVHCCQEIGIELPEDEDITITLPRSQWQVISKAIDVACSDRIAELEKQVDKYSHYEAMAHQGGYEIGYAEGLKKASEK